MILAIVIAGPNPASGLRSRRLVQRSALVAVVEDLATTTMLEDARDWFIYSPVTRREVGACKLRH